MARRWASVLATSLLLACSSEFAGGHGTGGAAGSSGGGTTSGGAGGTSAGGTSSGGTSTMGGAAGSGGGTSGASGASGSGGIAGSGGTAGTSGTGGLSGSGGLAGAGGSGGCGDGSCGPGEILSCYKDCANWYHVVNATNPVNAATTTDPQTWRGDLTLTSTSTYKTNYTHTSGASATENHTYTLTSSLAMTADNNAGAGQMSPAADFFALGGVSAPLQLFAVRKGNGFAKSSIAGTYRVRGLLGRKSDKKLFGLSGTVKFNTSGCIVAGSTGLITDGSTPLAIVFVAAPATTGTGCATVGSSGSISLPHQQSSNNGTVSTTFEGWIGSGGDVILWTHNEATGFEPGVILAVREKAGHGNSKVKGTYGVTHLLELNSVRGTITVSGGSVTGGSLSIITGGPFPLTGGSYSVSANGNMALTLVDSISTGYQAGQASNYTANGLSPILLTSAATSQNPALDSDGPSLMVWVLR